jgi:hypothetical protein
MKASFSSQPRKLYRAGFAAAAFAVSVALGAFVGALANHYAVSGGLAAGKHIVIAVAKVK